MRLYFVRHGESEANTQRIISNRALPHHLTALGRRQAASLAQELRGVAVRAIYTSPVPRAVETAGILAEAFGLVSQTYAALREFDCGEMEGRADGEAWAAHRRVTEAWVLQGDLEARIPGGESFVDLRGRFVPFIKNLVTESAADAPADDRVFVGHGGLYGLMLPLVLANIRPDFARAHILPHSRPVVVEARPGGLVCVDWAGLPVTA